MAPPFPLFAFSVLSLCCSVWGQQLTIVAPPNSSVVQCANLSIEWSGGTSPFFLTMGTPDDANVTDFEAVQSVEKPPYFWDVDMPAGTEITLFVRDADGTTAETPLITIQNSTNSSCLPGSDNPPPPPPSHTGHSFTTGTAILSADTTTHIATSTSPFSSATTTHTSKTSSSTSHVAVIAGVVIGVLALLALIVILMTIQKRRQRRDHTTSKDALVRTFGSTKADLDGISDEDVEAMAIPEPYVYGSVSSPRTATLTAIDTEDLSRSASALRPSPGGASGRSVSTPASRKGERYLPNHAASPQERSPGGASSRSRIQDEEIDRLAARMVAMMSVGRLTDQAWTAGDTQTRGREIGGDDDFQTPPPTYGDVARKIGPRPRGGGF